MKKSAFVLRNWTGVQLLKKKKIKIGKTEVAHIQQSDFYAVILVKESQSTGKGINSRKVLKSTPFCAVSRSMTH